VVHYQEQPIAHVAQASRRVFVKLLRTGLILNTENYDACVSFYGTVLGLKTMFTKTEDEDRLTCFEFGGAYLMVETGGHAKPLGKSVQENSAKLRFHVESLEATRQYLVAQGIEAEISTFSWGSTINIHDPDGNRIGIREEREFAGQMQQ
jgi:lactoylglutathione lyase